MSKGKVVVAMSGGVDSSVAAYLLKEAGYEVVGITMRLSSSQHPDYARQNRRCCTAEDADDARRVCRVLGLPHYVLNFEKEFHTHVIEYFLEEYRRGRTPNPCLACNDYIKFDFLMRKARALGAEKLATGHYARIDCAGGRYRLLRARDPTKDQTYVLYSLGQRELRYLLFPAGEHAKSDIRSIAQELRLPVADKPDSQDICFIPDGDYRSFVRNHIEPHEGAIVDTDGTVLGKHDGVESFTIGQRKGLGINTGARRYVIDISAEENRVVVGAEKALYCTSLIATNVRYTSDSPPADQTTITAKVRHRSPEVEAELIAMGYKAEVRFRTPQRAVAP
ncbi:MAG: tRNA 2-thiouridine(34) synthase MnmA, partial [Dehalococcoidia bacterium]